MVFRGNLSSRELFIDFEDFFGEFAKWIVARLVWEDARLEFHVSRFRGQIVVRSESIVDSETDKRVSRFVRNREEGDSFRFEARFFDREGMAAFACEGQCLGCDSDGLAILENPRSGRFGGDFDALSRAFGDRCASGGKENDQKARKEEPGEVLHHG